MTHESRKSRSAPDLDQPTFTERFFESDDDALRGAGASSEDFDGYEADDRSRGRGRPVWVSLSVAVNIAIFIALLPFVMVLLFPPFALYFVELAKMVVFVAPILLAGDLLSLWWGFPRKRAVVTSFSMLGIAFVAIAFAIAIYAAGDKDPILVLGIPFGGGQ